MAGRIRSIKPEILDDEVSSRLSDAAWRLWVSMWLLADDYGRLRGSPVWLEGQVFWNAEDESRRPIRELLAELRAAKVIIPYEVSGQSYFQVRTWKKHQRVDHPGPPRVPAPPEALANDSRTAREALANDLDLDPDQDLDRDQEGEHEGKGQQKALPPARGTQGSFFGVSDPPKQAPTQEPKKKPKGKKKPNASEKRATFAPSDNALKVLAELNRRRLRSVKGAHALSATATNLEEIQGRLNEGHTVEDLLHVAAVAEGKYHRDNESVYFNATTPYRAGNIARYLAEPKPEIRIVKEFPEPEPHERPMPFGITDEQVRESMARHGYDKPPDITAALLEWDKAETERKKREGGGGDGA